MPYHPTLYPPASAWTPPRVSDLPSWAEAKRVAVDVETYDPTLTTLGPGVRRGGYVVGVSFAIEDGPAHYLPIRHSHGTNLDEAQVLSYLRQQAFLFRGDLVGANLSYDLDYLAQLGIWYEPSHFRDVQVAEPLLDELQNNYSLDAIAERWGLPGKDEVLLRHAAEAFGVDPKNELFLLPPEYVGAYAEQDVRLPLSLLRRQERKIDEEGLWDIYNLESDLLPVLVKVQRRGVAVSAERLDEVERWCLGEESKALEAVRGIAGVSVAPDDVWKAEAVAKVLRKIGVTVPTTPVTGKASIDKELLASIKHPVAPLLATARRINKIRTTFVKSIRDHLVNGRIHCTLRQLRGTGGEGDREGEEGGGRFGRLSSKNPNMQQQPARDPDLGPLWRSIYVPDDGMVWACLDYSQQEPRWLVHYAELTGCPGAKEAADRYRTDPKTDSHQMMSDLTGLPRKQAKDIFLGKCYNMGGAKLCHSLKLPTEWVTTRSGKVVEVAGDEGMRIIQQFDKRVPYVSTISKMCEEKAARVGFIRTTLGRRCRFPKVTGGYDWTHKALNRLIQGSSADQTKKAMVEADRAGFAIQLQVHDELDLSLHDRSEAEPLAEIMRTCVPCRVPMRVDVETGPDWGHCK